MITYRYKLVLILIIFLLLSSGLCFYLVYERNTREPAVTHYSFALKSDFWEEAYDQGGQQIKKISSHVYGGIIPHHLIVKDKIAAFFLSLEKFDYNRVVLISPNHFDQGQAKVITSKAVWQTPYGLLGPDLEEINELIDSRSVGLEEDPFVNEHGIYNLVSFIKKSFPRARFIPLIIRSDFTAEESEILAKNLADSLDINKTLVIASVDFSHNYPTKIADAHDLVSRSVIQNFNFNEVYKIDIDSPPAIYTLLKYLDLNKVDNSELLFATNSGRLVGQENIPTTSHQVFIFY